MKLHPQVRSLNIFRSRRALTSNLQRGELASGCEGLFTAACGLNFLFCFCCFWTFLPPLKERPNVAREGREFDRRSKGPMSDSKPGSPQRYATTVPPGHALKCFLDSDFKGMLTLFVCAAECLSGPQSCSHPSKGVPVDAGKRRQRARARDPSVNRSERPIERIRQMNVKLIFF